MDRSHTAPGTLPSHKVDGSRSAEGTAPELVASGGAKVFADELTLTYARSRGSRDAISSTASASWTRWCRPMPRRSTRARAGSIRPW